MILYCWCWFWNNSICWRSTRSAIWTILKSLGLLLLSNLRCDGCLRWREVIINIDNYCILLYSFLGRVDACASWTESIRVKKKSITVLASENCVAISYLRDVVIEVVFGPCYLVVGWCEFSFLGGCESRRSLFLASMRKLYYNIHFVRTITWSQNGVYGLRSSQLKEPMHSWDTVLGCKFALPSLCWLGGEDLWHETTWNYHQLQLMYYDNISMIGFSIEIFSCLQSIQLFVMS